MNRSAVVFLVIFLFSSTSLFCQSLITKSAFVGFYSKTPFEDIRAENNQVYAMIDPETHSMAFALLVRGFIFTKELMQEHFNENYMESDKFPKATFNGECSGDMVLSKEGIYQVVIKGNLSLHGVTRPIETTAQLEVKPDRILGTASFNVKPGDFNISIPGVVSDKIAKEINVKVQTIWMRKT